MRRPSDGLSLETIERLGGFEARRQRSSHLNHRGTAAACVQVGELPVERRIVSGRGDLCLVRIVYRAHVVGGLLRHGAEGTTDEARWVPLVEVAGLDRVDLVDIGLAMLPSPAG